MTSLLSDFDGLTLKENQDEDDKHILANLDSSGGHELVETPRSPADHTSHHSTGTSLMHDPQILPVEKWLPHVLVTTYKSDLGKVDFRISADQELTAVIHDDQLCTIFRKHFSIQPKQILPLALMLYVLQQLDNEWLPLATLVDELVELDLTRLRSRRIEKSDVAHRICGDEFFLTILRRVKDGDALIYRVVPMTVDGEALCENPTATVPGKIMRVEVRRDQPAQLSFTLWYLFRHDNVTYLDHADSTDFADLNDRVYFQVRQEGAENGYILDIPAEIKISPWDVKWEADREELWDRRTKSGVTCIEDSSRHL